MRISLGLGYVVKPDTTGWAVFSTYSDKTYAFHQCGVPFSVRHGRRFTHEELECQAYNAAIYLCDTRKQTTCARAADKMKARTGVPI